MFVVNTLSKYMEYPMQVHLVETKHVMRYLKGTLDYGLRCVTNHEVGLYGYSDSDGPTLFVIGRVLQHIASV